MKFDLHCHSTASDGSLTPDELVQRAHENGVTHLSITDHDTVAAYKQIDWKACPLTLIPGIEISSTWSKRGVHIVGLGIDLKSAAIAEAVQQQSLARQLRAEKIAERLTKSGLRCPLEEVEQLAAGGQLGRPHFARYLVASGQVKDSQQAFKKYLGDGKPGDVKQHWASLEQTVQWILDAGGVAVLAHPLKYKLTRTKLLALVQDFKALGGQAMEVVSGKQTPQESRKMADICQQSGLLASCGSDFHHPDTRWAELGMYSTLPSTVDTVFSHLDFSHQNKAQLD
ncbi:PHP domain-containing protein [Porticoccus sp. W117]|nr:PHP domain-containing protein [Porticoccus sp. W117]MDM3871131.1 PHP domain-containing protein [Porticoccus sp. W117]